MLQPRSSRFVFLGMLLLGLCVCGSTAHAQDFPNRPLRLIIPQGPGGTADVLVRILVARVSDSLGQQIVVEYRPGANAIVGLEAAAKAAPDGYTLVLGTSNSLAVNAALYKKLPYDPVADFAPVALLGKTYFTVLVPNSSPAHSVKDFIALAKARPGRLNYGASSSGTRVSIEIFAAAAKIGLNYVPYKSTAQAMTDLIGGRLDLIFEALATAVPQVKAGNARLLGITGPSRLGQYPEFQTIAESGLPGYEYSAWASIHAPAGIPGAIQQKLSGEIQKALSHPELAAQYRGAGFEPQYGNPEQLAALLRSDLEVYKKTVRIAPFAPIPRRRHS